MLSCSAAKSGYTSNQWATFNRWRKLGANVRKGEKSTLIACPGKVAHENTLTGETVFRAVWKVRTVFNADQVDGYKSDCEVAPKDSDTAVKIAKALAEKSCATVHYDEMDSAYYSPARDSVHIPAPSRFKTGEAFACTLLHELAHWTGHESRLDRQVKNKHASAEYAFEELVAELAAAMLAGSNNITPTPRLDHAQYLNHWVQLLAHQPNAIMRAASLAESAADYLAEAKQ